MENFSFEVFKEKKYVILFSLILVFLILVFALRETPTDNYMLVGNYLIWHEKNGDLYQLRKPSKAVSSVRYKLYYDNGVAESADNQFINNKWVFFNNNYEQIRDGNFLLAYSGKKKIDIFSYDSDTYDDSDELLIKKISNTSSEDKLEKFKNSLRKVSFDYDGDGKEETLYFFHNYIFKIVNYTPECYMALVKDGKVLDVVKSDEDNVFLMMNILSLDRDKYKELIIGKGVVDIASFDSCYQIYNVKKGKLVLKQDCLFE